MGEEQSYLMTVMNEEGHFVKAIAVESKEEGMKKSTEYEDKRVSLVPCDSFEGFDQTS